MREIFPTIRKISLYIVSFSLALICTQFVFDSYSEYREANESKKLVDTAMEELAENASLVSMVTLEDVLGKIDQNYSGSLLQEETKGLPVCSIMAGKVLNLDPDRKIE